MSTAVTLIDHSTREHSPTGGSSAERVLRCPGSVTLSEKFPNVESEFAAEGSALHEAMNMILDSETIKNEREVIGLKFNGIVLTEALFNEGIKPALETFDKLSDELGGIDFYVEKRLVFPGITGSFGTGDIVGKARDRSIVLDWKFGRGVAVSAVENEQLMYYAWAAMHTPATAKFFSPDKPIEVFIVQPMVNDGEPFTRWTITAAQLEVFAKEYIKAVEIAYNDDPPYQLGSWCKFCNAKTGCPLQLGQVRKAAEMTREEIVAHLNELLPFADNFIAVGEAIKELAHAELEKGGVVKGWKLVPKRPVRKWIDDDKILKYLAKVGLPAADRYVKKLVSPAQAETALKKAKLPDQLPDGFVVKESSGTTLAPDSDPRQAVVAAPGMFKALAEKLAAR